MFRVARAEVLAWARHLSFQRDCANATWAASVGSPPQKKQSFHGYGADPPLLVSAHMPRFHTLVRPTHHRSPCLPAVDGILGGAKGRQPSALTVLLREAKY